MICENCGAEVDFPNPHYVEWKILGKPEIKTGRFDYDCAPPDWRTRCLAAEEKLAAVLSERNQAMRERDALQAEKERDEEYLRETLRKVDKEQKGLAVCSWCALPTNSDDDSKRKHQFECAKSPLVERLTPLTADLAEMTAAYEQERAARERAERQAHANYVDIRKAAGIPDEWGLIDGIQRLRGRLAVAEDRNEIGTAQLAAEKSKREAAERECNEASQAAMRWTRRSEQFGHERDVAMIERDAERAAREKAERELAEGLTEAEERTVAAEDARTLAESQRDAAIADAAALQRPLDMLRKAARLLSARGIVKAYEYADQERTFKWEDAFLAEWEAREITAGASLLAAHKRDLEQRVARIAELEKHLEVARAMPWTNCPDCGRNVAVDEDGCCTMCGADALHYGVDELLNKIAAHAAELAAKDEYIRKLDRENDDAADEVRRLTAEVARLNGLLNIAKIGSGAAHSSLAALDTELDAANERIRRLEEEREPFRAALAETFNAMNAAWDHHNGEHHPCEHEHVDQLIDDAYGTAVALLPALAPPAANPAAEEPK